MDLTRFAEVLSMLPRALMRAVAHRRTAKKDLARIDEAYAALGDACAACDPLELTLLNRVQGQLRLLLQPRAHQTRGEVT
jgi:hypothetical protein